MGLIRNWRRRQLRREPFSPEWQELLQRDMPLYRRLGRADRSRLQGHIQVILAEKHFEGCGGQAIDDRVRLVIAAHAALLLLRRPGDYYPLLGSVLVYPTSFAAPVRETDRFGIVTETVEERLGESWEFGTIVLAWDSILEVIEARHQGLNVMLHEFAHQLDAEDGVTDGAPLRHLEGSIQDWAEICGAEYARMRSNRRRGRPLVLDPYGLESPAEFFAVATETFFERPVRLKAHHPQLYAVLQALYRQDPAGWTD